VGPRVSHDVRVVIVGCVTKFWRQFYINVYLTHTHTHTHRERERERERELKAMSRFPKLMTMETCKKILTLELYRWVLRIGDL
jgi:hypothetical protein